jgi:hypothetical protein
MQKTNHLSKWHAMQFPTSRLTIMRFFSGLLFALCFVVAWGSFSDYFARSQMAVEMVKEHETLAKNQRCAALLRAEVEGMEHPEKVRAVIENELHWGAPGATIYRFHDQVIDESLRGTPCYGL